MITRRPPYVEGAALVEGFAAHVLDRVLARHLPAYLAPFSATQRAEVDAARSAINRAADAYERRPLSAVNGSAETHGEETSAHSAHEISTSEAAVILGLGERRARQLAAGGMGRKVGRAWLLDRSAVLAYRDERRTA